MRTADTMSTKHTTPVSWGPVVAILVVIASYYGGQLLASSFLAAVFGMFGWSNQQLFNWVSQSTSGRFIAMAVVELATLLLIYAFMRWKKTGFRAIGLVKPRLRDCGLALIGYGVYIPLYLVVVAVLKLLIPSLDLAQTQQIGFSQTQNSTGLIVVFISLVILPPLIEEIVCRGFLYSGLRTRLSIAVTAVVASTLFALPHLQFGSGAPLLWIAFIDTFVLSLVLVYLRYRTNSLWAPISLHAIKNGVAFTVLFVLST